MKVVQIDEHEEQTYTVKVHEEEACPTFNCFILERVVFWSLMTIATIMFFIISLETRTSMHLQNLSLRDEMKQRSMLRHDFYKHDNRPVWMP